MTSTKKVNKQDLASEHEVSPEAQLVEYQATQSSAEHHDTVSWSVNSVIWGASLVLLGFAHQSLQTTSNKLLLSAIAILGIVMTLAAWRIWRVLRGVVKGKYAHCRQLEEQLGMSQHLNAAHSYPTGMARRLFSLISVLFLFAWLVVLWSIWM